MKPKRKPNQVVFLSKAITYLTENTNFCDRQSIGQTGDGQTGREKEKKTISERTNK